MSQKKCLVIGGTSGLGLEMAKDFSELDYKVIITGRKNPNAEQLEYYQLDLADSVPEKIIKLVEDVGHVDVLIYCAAFYQEGRITDLSPEEIESMINVCGRGLVYLSRELLNKQDSISELITITSTSQWTPRKLEPVYNFVKAGQGHFSNALAEDGRINKVLVVGPAGMRTGFWDGVERNDLDEMLDPAWVADEIMTARDNDYKYKYIKILRQPARVEEVEQR